MEALRTIYDDFARVAIHRCDKWVCGRKRKNEKKKEGEGEKRNRVNRTSGEDCDAQMQRTKNLGK